MEPRSTRRAASEDFQRLFQRIGASRGPEAGQCVAGEQAPAVQYCNLAGELFDLRQRMQRENHCRPVDTDNILEQKSPEFSGRERIQAARGFIEEQHRRPVKHGARQA